MTNIPGFNEEESAWISEFLHCMDEEKEFSIPPPSKRAGEYMI